MPPKTAAEPATRPSRPPMKEGGGRKGPGAAAAAAPAKAEEPTGPIIKANIQNAAPAPRGMSFLDALRAGTKGAAPAQAASAAAAPAAAAAAAAHEEERKAAAPATQKAEAAAKSEPAAAEPEPVAAAPEPVVAAAAAPAPAEAAPERVEEPVPQNGAAATAAAAVEAVAAAAAAAAAQQPSATAPANTESRFNWASDEEINFQFRQPSAPQFAVAYPESVLDNRARNIVFKVPSDAQKLANAVEQLSKERATFEADRVMSEERLKARAAELDMRENDIANHERQNRVEAEKLQQERLQLQQQQQQLQQQQAAAQAAAAAQARTSATQSPAARVTTPPQQIPQQPAPMAPAQSPSQPPQPPMPRWNPHMGGHPMPSGYDWAQQQQQQQEPRWGGNAMGDMYIPYDNSPNFGQVGGGRNYGSGNMNSFRGGNSSSGHQVGGAGGMPRMNMTRMGGNHNNYPRSGGHGVQMMPPAPQPLTGPFAGGNSNARMMGGNPSSGGMGNFGSIPRPGHAAPQQQQQHYSSGNGPW